MIRAIAEAPDNFRAEINRRPPLRRVALISVTRFTKASCSASINESKCSLVDDWVTFIAAGCA
jgi:hypothetical protein